MYYAQTHVRKAHARDILAQGHALAAVRVVLHRGAQAGGDEPDGLQMEHVRNGAGALRDVALDGVGQRVHARRRRQRGRHRGHHVRVNHRDLGDVVRVHADELALFLHVGDDVVYRDLRGGAGGRRDRYREHRVLLRRRHALKGAHVRELGVVYDDADGLRRVHDRAAAHGHDAVRARGLEGRDAALDVLDGRVRLDVAEDLVGDARRVEQGRDLRAAAL